MHLPSKWPVVMLVAAFCKNGGSNYYEPRGCVHRLAAGAIAVPPLFYHGSWIWLTGKSGWKIKPFKMFWRIKKKLRNWDDRPVRSSEFALCSYAAWRNEQQFIILCNGFTQITWIWGINRMFWKPFISLFTAFIFDIKKTLAYLVL